MGDDIDPLSLAIADQELAECERVLGELLERWQATDFGELDKVRRVASFMAQELFPLGRIAYPLLALAISRLRDGE